MAVFTDYYSNLQELLLKQSETIGAQTDSSKILGDDREMFIRDVLKKSLPSSILVDSGVIVDSNGKESNPQDIILYRSDFPIISSHVGSRKFISEGVIACIEMKSNLVKEEFTRAINTLETASGLSRYNVKFPTNLKKEDIPKFGELIKTCGYLKNKMTTQKYVFAYRGVLLDTIVEYLDEYLPKSSSFLNLPSVICILDRGICLIRDDGQVTPPIQPDGDLQCIYLVFSDAKRTLEFFMLHILNSCLTSSGGLQIPGTPISFSIFDYMERDVNAKPMMVKVHRDIMKDKIQWEGRKHLTTNDLVERHLFRK